MQTTDWLAIWGRMASLYPFDVHNVLFRVKKGVTGSRYLLEYNTQNAIKRMKKGVTDSHDVLS